MILASLQRGLAAGVITAAFALGSGPGALAQPSKKPAPSAQAKPAAKPAAKPSAKAPEKAPAKGSAAKPALRAQPSIEASIAPFSMSDGETR